MAEALLLNPIPSAMAHASWTEEPLLAPVLPRLERTPEAQSLSPARLLPEKLPQDPLPVKIHVEVFVAPKEGAATEQFVSMLPVQAMAEVPALPVAITLQTDRLVVALTPNSHVLSNVVTLRHPRTPAVVLQVAQLVILARPLPAVIRPESERLTPPRVEESLELSMDPTTNSVPSIPIQFVPLLPTQLFLLR